MCKYFYRITSWWQKERNQATGRIVGVSHFSACPPLLGNARVKNSHFWSLFCCSSWDSYFKRHYNVISSGRFVLVSWACLWVSKVQITVKIPTGTCQHNFKEDRNTSISHRCSYQSGTRSCTFPRGRQTIREAFTTGANSGFLSQ